MSSLHLMWQTEGMIKIYFTSKTTKDFFFDIADDTQNTKAEGGAGKPV